MYSIAFLISCVFQILLSAKVAKYSPPTLHCLHNGQVYPLGNFQPSVCAHCHCDDLGHVTCAPELCPPPRCVDFIKDPSKCCPVCPNGMGFKTMQLFRFHATVKWYNYTFMFNEESLIGTCNIISVTDCRWSIISSYQSWGLTDYPLLTR